MRVSVLVKTTRKGGTRNFPTEGVELPTGCQKGLKIGVVLRHFAKFLLKRTQISSDWGLDASDGGGCSPLAPPGAFSGKEDATTGLGNHYQELNCFVAND